MLSAAWSIQEICISGQVKLIQVCNLSPTCFSSQCNLLKNQVSWLWINKGYNG